jgi:hypothetical protein
MSFWKRTPGVLSIVAAVGFLIPACSSENTTRFHSALTGEPCEPNETYGSECPTSPPTPDDDDQEGIIKDDVNVCPPPGCDDKMCCDDGDHELPCDGGVVRAPDSGIVIQ